MQIDLVRKLLWWYTFFMKNTELSHEEEYKIIRSDLRKVLLINAVYLVVLLALYYTNKNSGYLYNWFAKILHF